MPSCRCQGWWWSGGGGWARSAVAVGWGCFVALAACTPYDPALPSCAIACAASDDCPAGFTCTQGICAGAGQACASDGGQDHVDDRADDRGVDWPGDEPGPAVDATIAAPRLIAPLASARVTSRRPTLRWALAPGSDGARVEICATRTCADLVAGFDATGTQGRPATDLSQGTYFWRARGRRGAVTGQDASVVWPLTVAAGAEAGAGAVDTSWGTTFDPNGDRAADVVVGAEGVLNSRGRVYLYAGGSEGLEATPRTTLTGPEGPNEYFGHAVASAGDVNGDGYVDLLVGAYSHSRAYVYLGGASGLGPAPIALRGSEDLNGSFGWAVASAGDVNGDGRADVVIGAQSFETLTGRAYVYYGGAAGVSPAPDLTLAAPGMNSTFGFAVASAGDVDNDGHPDLLVGAPNLDNGTGAFYLYRGRAGGGLELPQTFMGSEGQLTSFGAALAGGFDVNGDGYADAVVASEWAAGRAGRVRVYLGGAGGLAPAPKPVLEAPDGADGHFGHAVAGAGDVNGDGFDDVLVGAFQVFGTVGRAYLFLGGAAGLATAPVTTFDAPVGVQGQFGKAVAGVGDVNGDGFDDFVVGLPYPPDGTGQVAFYFGAAGGPASAAARLLTGPDGPDGNFGGGLAWRVQPRSGRSVLDARLPPKGRYMKPVSNVILPGP